MIYFLDTDHFTLSILPDSPEYSRLRDRTLNLTRDDDLVTTIITYEEQTRGWLAYAAKSRDTEHQIKAYAALKVISRITSGFTSWTSITPRLRTFQTLAALKLRVGTSDLKIASIALANNAILLSRNLQDFKKIPNLRVEDWTRL